MNHKINEIINLCCDDENSDNDVVDEPPYKKVKITLMYTIDRRKKVLQEKPTVEVVKNCEFIPSTPSMSSASSSSNTLASTTPSQKTDCYVKKTKVALEVANQPSDEHSKEEQELLDILKRECAMDFESNMIAKFTKVLENSNICNSDDGDDKNKSTIVTNENSNKENHEEEVSKEAVNVGEENTKEHHTSHILMQQVVEEEVSKIDEQKEAAEKPVVNEVKQEEVSAEKEAVAERKDVKKMSSISPIIEQIEILDSEDEEDGIKVKEIEKNQETKEVEESTNDTIQDASSENKDDVSTAADVANSDEDDDYDPTYEKDIEKLLNIFLDKVRQNLSSTSHNALILKRSQSCKDFHKKLVEYKFRQWDEINTLLTDFVNNFKFPVQDTIISMGKVYEWFKNAYDDHLLSIDKEKIVSAEEKKWVMQVNKLQKLHEKLLTKIRTLEESEVNFEDEENSSYLQADYYKQRLKKVYDLLCKKLKGNPQDGSMLHKCLNINEASSQKLNKLINAHYRLHLSSPNFHQFNKFVRKVVKEHRIEYNECDLSHDIKSCFKALCKNMSKRRKQDLYQVQRDYLDMKPDFDEEDESLKTKLEKHQSEGTRKINEIIDKYASLQESGKEDVLENRDEDVMDTTEDESKSSESDFSDSLDSD